MNYSQFHAEVYAKDFPDDGPHGWIQWKGTNVCIDLRCKCGYRGHFDGEFFYHYRCPECKTGYSLGQNVKLIELSPEQSTFIESGGHCPFRSDDNEDGTT